MAMRRKGIFKKVGFFIVVVSMVSSFTSCTLPPSMTLEALKDAIVRGETAPDADSRLLVVDVRKSSDFIEGHIKDALSAPLAMIAEGVDPLYTNGYDEVSTTASTALADSWLAHLLINQLVNDFMSTYEDSRMVFYGATVAEGVQAAQIAQKIGYRNVSFLAGDYATWRALNSGETEQYYAGVESVNTSEGSFVMTGYINNTNFENVSTRATHHCIIFKGGGLHHNGLLQVNMAPFCFQELLTYLGVSPQGNMANGIYFGDMDVWGSKYPDGEQVEFTVTWEGASRYYALNEIFEEKPSEFQPDPALFEPVGMEARIGGTRDSNLNWNPGCIFCWYACVCGITSNARANEVTWFADGGIYDVINSPEDPRNYYAGRYYPRLDILPGEGEAIKIKVRKAQ